MLLFIQSFHWHVTRWIGTANVIWTLCQVSRCYNVTLTVTTDADNVLPCTCCTPKLCHPHPPTCNHKVVHCWHQRYIDLVLTMLTLLNSHEMVSQSMTRWLVWSILCPFYTDRQYFCQVWIWSDTQCLTRDTGRGTLQQYFAWPAWNCRRQVTANN